MAKEGNMKIVGVSLEVSITDNTVILWKIGVRIKAEINEVS